MKAPNALIEAIEAEKDVRTLHKLEFSPEMKRWLYLIETPFQTFPRYVVGWVDEKGGVVKHVSKHGAKWSADASFYRTLEEAKNAEQAPALPIWQTGEPPHDSSRAVIILGQLDCEEESGGWCEPVCAEAIWTDSPSFTGWLFSGNRLAIQQSPEDKLNIFFWSEVPCQKDSELEKAVSALERQWEASAS